MSDNTKLFRITEFGNDAFVVFEDDIKARVFRPATPEEQVDFFDYGVEPETFPQTQYANPGFFRGAVVDVESGEFCFFANVKYEEVTPQ